MAFKILVPTDLSPNSLAAMQFAMTLAQPLQASLDILHVVDLRFASELPLATPLDVEAEKKKMLAQADGALLGLTKAPAEGFDLRLHTRTGNPSEEICTEANMLDSDLLVLSTHGRTGLAHLLMGSVAERVVRAATCPVLTLRVEAHPSAAAQSNADDGAETEAPAIVPAHLRLPQRLLVATDLSESSIPALKMAASLAERLDASVTLVHVLDMAYTSLPLLASHGGEGDLQSELIHKSGEALRTFLEAHEDELGARILEAPVLLQIGEAAAELLEAARETATDLIILGRHGYSGFRRLLMGSVAESVVRQAPCPVLTIPIIPAE